MLLCSGLDVLANAAAHLQLGEPVPLQGQRQLEPRDDVHRLEQLHALLERQVGRVGAGVRERTRFADGTEKRADPRIGIA